MARADLVRAQLEQCGIEYLIWLPDSETRFLYDAIMASSLRLVQVCNEEEAMGVHTGLYMGGKSSAVLIQNTGLFHSLDGLRGLVLACRLPMLLMVGYRGYKGLVEGKHSPDSAGLYTEPVLDALGIRHHLVDNDEDVQNIGRAFQETMETNRPVAVLVGKEYD